MKKNVQQMPNGSWPITVADKASIVELGRKLHKVVLDYATDRGELHVRVLAGACQYLMDLQDQKKAALGDDIFVSQKLLNDTGLSEKIIEPFMAEEEKAVAAPAEEAGAAAAESTEEKKTEEAGAEGAAAESGEASAEEAGSGAAADESQA